MVVSSSTVIFALPESMPLTDFVKAVEDKPFSRIPVYKTNRDEITGFVMRDEVLIAHLKDASDQMTLAEMTRVVDSGRPVAGRRSVIIAVL